MTTPDMPMYDDIDTSEPEDSAAPDVFIQHGLRNEAFISRPIHGQVTQVGKENIVNICTEMKTFQFKISSKQKDVEAIVAINMIPDKDFDPTKTLVLGRETTQREITTGEQIIFRIECDEQAKRQGNGYTIGCDLRSKTRGILTSLFGGLNMLVNYIRRGSIIIGLQPQTDRAVFTLLNAMEGGFIEELVRGILENEPDGNIDDDLNEPIKMKIDINIPQGMFPKEFPCKKFESRKELLQELKVSLQRKKKEQEETVKKEIVPPKSSAPEMSLDESRTLMSEMDEEMSTRKDYVTDINETTKWWRMRTEIEETSKDLMEELRLIKATEKAEKDVAAGISKSVKKDVLMGSEKKTADIAHSEESKDFEEKIRLMRARRQPEKMGASAIYTSDISDVLMVGKNETAVIARSDERKALEKNIRLMRARRQPEKMGASAIYTSDRRDVLMVGENKTAVIARSDERKALEKKIRLMRAGGIAGAAAVGAVIAGPVGAAIGGFALGTYWVISDLWSSYSRRNTQNKLLITDV